MLAAVLTLEGGVFAFLVASTVSLVVYIWKGETDRAKENNTKLENNTTAVTELTAVMRGIKDDINSQKTDIVENSRGIMENAVNIATLKGRIGGNGTAA